MVASEQKAVVAAPSMRPMAASMPESSSSVSSSTVPGVEELPEPGQRVARVVGLVDHDLPAGGGGGRHCSTVRNATATLWPPKPNELFRREQLAVGQVAWLTADDVEA